MPLVVRPLPPARNVRPHLCPTRWQCRMPAPCIHARQIAHRSIADQHHHCVIVVWVVRLRLQPRIHPTILSVRSRAPAHPPQILLIVRFSVYIQQPTLLRPSTRRQQTPQRPERPRANHPCHPKRPQKATEHRTLQNLRLDPLTGNNRHDMLFHVFQRVHRRNKCQRSPPRRRQRFWAYRTRRYSDELTEALYQLDVSALVV